MRLSPVLVEVVAVANKSSGSSSGGMGAGGSGGKGGGSGRAAIVLGKLPVPGHPTNWDVSSTRAYCACSRCG